MKMCRLEKIKKAVVWAAILAFAACSGLQAKNMLDWRCFIWTGGDYVTLKEMMTNGASWGYNGLWLEGASLKKIAQNGNPTDYRDKLNDVLAHGKSLNYTVVPVAQGQTWPALVDQNLAEGWPVKKSVFVVSGSSAGNHRGDLEFVNAGFEEGLAGWRGKTGPEEPLRIDTTVAYKGKASLKARHMPDNTYHQDDLMGCYQRLKVRPYCAYELSMMVKTSQANGSIGANKTRFVVKASGLPLYKNRGGTSVRAGQNWKRESIVFSTLHYNSIEVIVSASPTFLKYGEVWFDEIKIQEVGLVNTVRRTNLPVVVTKTDGTVLLEGRDYAVGEGQLTNLNSSAVSGGDTLLVDWFNLANTIFEIPPASFCDWRTWEVVRGQIEIFDEWFNHPPIRHMKYGEWRESGWDPACIAKYNISEVGSGPYMGRVNFITEQLFKEANCNRQVTTWNDMWDPYANSKRTYQMVNGGTANSGLELSSSVIIMNWNSRKMKNSMLYFAGMHPDHPKKTVAQRQIMNCGKWTGLAEKWLNTLDTLEKDYGLPAGSVIGMTYQSFFGPESYGNMENMSLAAKAAGRWGTGPIPVPPKVAGCPATAPEAAIKGHRTNSAVPSLRLSVTALQGRGIRYTLSQHAGIRIVVSDILGRAVQVMTRERQNAGMHEFRLDAKRLSAGVRFVRLSAVGERVSSVTRKMVVF